MYCHKCGISVLIEDTFCYKCGANLKENTKNKKSAEVLVSTGTPAVSKTGNEDTIPAVVLEKPCKLSVISFVLSCILVFGSVPALVLSFISLKRIREKGLKGKYLAVWALIISCVTLIVLLIVILSRIYFDNIANLEGGRI
jgi:hypothetical protein